MGRMPRNIMIILTDDLRDDVSNKNVPPSRSGLGPGRGGPQSVPPVIWFTDLRGHCPPRDQPSGGRQAGGGRAAALEVHAEGETCGLALRTEATRLRLLQAYQCFFCYFSDKVRFFALKKFSALRAEKNTPNFFRPSGE